MFRSYQHVSRSNSVQDTRITRARDDLLTSMMSEGFPYSRKLRAHTSCVNALTFSSGDGRFLASGGDDLAVRLWDFHQDDIKEPSATLRGAFGNIFTLAFSTTNKYIYSGGTDERILKFDIHTLGSALDSVPVRSPDEVFREHNETIRQITCHPYQDEVFLSAAQDGRILRHDGRSNDHVRAQDTIQITSEVTGVQFHPIMEHLFVSSDSHGGVHLRDVRMAFGPQKSRTNQGIVQTYNTKLSRKSTPYLSNPEASSVSFDRDGSKLSVLMLHCYPTIYALSDPHPIAVCTGEYLPNGTFLPSHERGYSNSCTIKHGSFGGPGLDQDEFYATGSEDFRAYIWRIPPVAELTEKRVEIGAMDWDNQDSQCDIAFAQNMHESRYLPVNLSRPEYRLTGHDSIVNSAIFHPYFLHVLTCGVENSILLHSPTPSSPCCEGLERTPTDVRTLGDDDEEARHLYYRALLSPPMSEGDADSERRTILMFDHILREESGVDVFQTRKVRDSDGSSDEEMESDEDDGMEGHWLITSYMT